MQPVPKAVRPVRRATSTSGAFPNNCSSHSCQSLRPLKFGICNRLRFSTTPDTECPIRRAVSLSGCFPKRSISHLCQKQEAVNRLPDFFRRKTVRPRRRSNRETSFSDFWARNRRDARLRSKALALCLLTIASIPGRGFVGNLGRGGS